MALGKKWRRKTRNFPIEAGGKKLFSTSWPITQDGGIFFLIASPLSLDTHYVLINPQREGLRSPLDVYAEH
jgi:hypothetical protein